jgi:hypothetical protein
MVCTNSLETNSIISQSTRGALSILAVLLHTIAGEHECIILELISKYNTAATILLLCFRISTSSEAKAIILANINHLVSKCMKDDQ